MSIEDLAKPLTKLQRATVLNMVSGMTQRQAYKQAGGKAKDRAADAVVSRMLTDVNVKAYYDALMGKTERKVIATKEKVVAMLSAQVDLLITDICTFEHKQVGLDENDEPVYQTVWRMKDSKDIKAEHLACIKSVTATKAGPKIELFDKVASAKLLADMMGWQAPVKKEITGADGEAIQVSVESKDVADALTNLLNQL